MCKNCWCVDPACNPLLLFLLVVFFILYRLLPTNYQQYFQHWLTCVKKDLLPYLLNTTKMIPCMCSSFIHCQPRDCPRPSSQCSLSFLLLILAVQVLFT